jgi:hypothetical protein
MSDHHSGPNCMIIGRLREGRLAGTKGLVSVAGALLLGAIVSAEATFSPAQRSWWSLQPVTKPAVPSVANRGWVKTPIDSFILARLEAKQLAPNPPADRRTLLRRVTIDLTGLPPTEEEIQQFLRDRSPDAWEKVVDRLLESPRHGERWARHWLDVARYADSDGFKADATRPNIWRYRDYVIQAFNGDKPFDRFVREQIAGDELYPGDPDALVAMGFNRHWTDETNAAGLLTRRQETLDDITNTTGAAYLGLTFGCARCHDHKYDPILHKDYYRLQAFFANTSFGDGPLPVKDQEMRRAYDAQKAVWEEKTKDIRAEMNQILEPLRKAKVMGGIKTFEDDVQEAILMDASKRNPFQQMMYHTAQPRITFEDEPDRFTLRQLKGDTLKRYEELKKKLAEFDSVKPAPLPRGQFMIDIGRQAPPVYTLKNGNVQNKGEEVQPGFLSILDPSDVQATPPPGLNSTGRRTVLANWLADPKNPLTARVMVNRIWHYHFGRGIVATPGDFGRMGAKPTHPELLDYIATSFVENGWSMKRLHRLILLSNTYQQSSAYQAKAGDADPENKLLWRYNRRRMEAEAVRDSMLATAGLLNLQMGGPGVFPPLPPGATTELSATAVEGGWKTEKDPTQINRRSIYIFVRRNLRYPMLQEFDSANTFESAHQRTNTVTPTQSLDLLNNDLVVEWSRAFAGRVLADVAASEKLDQAIGRAFRLAYGREITKEEQKMASAFLNEHASIVESQLSDKENAKPPMPTHVPKDLAPARAAAFVDLCQALLASNEFLSIN